MMHRDDRGWPHFRTWDRRHCWWCRLHWHPFGLCGGAR